MKTHPYTQIFAVLCTIALASCATPPEPTRIPVSVSARPTGSVSNRLFQEVNSYRRSRGSTELQRHSGLDRLAQAHCEFLRKNRGSFTLHGKNVSHTGFEGRSLIAQQRYQMYSVSENVAATSKVSGSTTQRLVDLWKNSRGHHKNMTDRWTHTGVGVVVDSDGMVFATQIFAMEGLPMQMTTRERFNRF